MHKIILRLIFLLISMPTMAIDLDDVYPDEVKLGPTVHKTLPESILKRIRAVTDVFESIDGISYERSVNFYKTKLNFEENLIVSEEMSRVYRAFCEKRCISSEERYEVHNALLMRSIFPSEKALNFLEFNHLTKDETIELISEYKMLPKLK